MIIDTSQSDIQVVGDIKEFKTSIDPKNLEFITTLLSSNLYSDPEQSFIREIVSNAWDSHVEAGTTDTPVIVRFRKEGELSHITIRDYGTGLSPERFNEIYRNIGSSTKRDSNDFIGGFGLGRFSALSCSNSVCITSYYNGIAYYYLMLKSGNSININLLMEKPTTEKNGVEVTIKNIKNTVPYVKALNYVIFFPNIYVEGTGSDDEINSTKLKRFKNFAAASTNICHKLLLGNVLYPINKSLLSSIAKDFIDRIEYTGIVIKFEIGELSVTPNRESIIYNKETIERIEAKIDAARQELSAIIDKKLAKDYTDIEEYNRVLIKPIHYIPVTDEVWDYPYSGSCRVDFLRTLNSSNVTYKGISLVDHLSFITNLLLVTFPTYRGVIYDDKIHLKKLPYRVDKGNRLDYPKILMLSSGTRLTEAIKLYLKENYNEYSIITYMPYVEFQDWVKHEFRIYKDLKHLDFIIKEVYDYLQSKVVKLNLSTDTEFLKFKANLSSGKVKLPVKEAILYIISDRFYRRDKKSFKKFSDAVDYIKSLKKGIILTNMDAPTLTYSRIAALKGYEFIQARKDIVEDLKKLNLTCLVDLDWLLYKDPLLSITKTVRTYFPTMPCKSEIESLCRSLPEEEAKEFIRIIRIGIKYGLDSFYSGVVDNSNVGLDPYTEYLCKKLKFYRDKHYEASLVVSESRLVGSLLVNAIILRTKAYRINNTAYRQLQNNKFIRVLCKK